MTKSEVVTVVKKVLDPEDSLREFTSARGHTCVSVWREGRTWHERGGRMLNGRGEVEERAVVFGLDEKLTRAQIVDRLSPLVTWREKEARVLRGLNAIAEQEGVT